jgi:hypothetical protein
MSTVTKFPFTLHSSDQEVLDKTVRKVLSIETDKTSVTFKPIEALADGDGIRIQRRRVVITSTDEKTLDTIQHLDFPSAVSVLGNGVAVTEK